MPVFQTAAEVKQACMDELNRCIQLDASGVAEAEVLYTQSIERLVDPKGPGEGWGTLGLERFNVRQVHGYAFRAIARIADEAIDRAGGNDAPIGAKDLRLAAESVTSRFRKKCPEQIKKGSVIPLPLQANGDLCRDI